MPMADNKKTTQAIQPVARPVNVVPAFPKEQKSETGARETRVPAEGEKR